MIQQCFIESCSNYLATVIHTPETSSKKVLVFFHGLGSTKDEFGYLYSRIAKNLKSYNSVLFDFYGCGDNEGTLSNVTLNSMKKDAFNIVKKIVKEYSHHDIYLIARGLSVPISFEIAEYFDIKGLIFISGRERFSFPTDKSYNYLLREWECNEYIEISKLLEWDAKQNIMKWLENLGAPKGYIMGDCLNFNLLKELESIKIGDFNKNILWFLREGSKNFQSENNKIEFSSYSYQYHELSDFIDPVVQDEMIIKIEKWLASN